MPTKTIDKLKTKASTKSEIKTPRKYKVIFFNDDFTPFDFVELLLINLFNKTKLEAQEIALKVHKDGKAIVALYPKEIAITKKHVVEIHAVNNHYPLSCEIEPE
jgi:ATP-dependent Clp protease adaptor protein ClpS